MEGIIEKRTLRPGYAISRVIKGGWQLSDGHNNAVSDNPVADMLAFAARGITTFDCADIYTGVEDLIGQFIEANRHQSQPYAVKVHTKYVPDWEELGTLSKPKVEAIIDRSLQRLKLERLDMVQFHWWNYQASGCVEAALWLQELQKAGKIDQISTTNFNTEKTREILDAGVPLVTTQVQYSLLDPRPEKALIGLCAEHDMQLLCYGTLAGGFLSERWLGKEQPDALENRSLVKYLLMIEEAGGWALFQSLLQLLKRIGDKHDATIAAVASRWVLDRARVGAVIIGSRNATHLDRYEEIFRLSLDTQDRSEIEAVRVQMHTPDLDVFDLERDKEGRHGRIMKYNLNEK